LRDLIVNLGGGVLTSAMIEA